MDIKEGNIVSCRYNGRYVKGKIEIVTRKYIVITLLTDYIGKNEEWYSGEKKVLYLKKMNNLKLQ